MKRNNKITGDIGEELAKEFLIRENYQILYKNFKTKIGEIDLIAKDKDTVVFVEVKTRKSLEFGMPYEAVDQRKIKKIIRVAENYIAYREIQNTQYRLSLIHI